MRRDEDLIRDILLRAVECGLPDNMVERLADDVRQDWGGDEYYVAEKPRGNAAEARRRLAAGEPRQKVMHETGISRSTLFRLLGQKS